MEKNLYNLTLKKKWYNNMNSEWSLCNLLVQVGGFQKKKRQKCRPDLMTFSQRSVLRETWPKATEKKQQQRKAKVTKDKHNKYCNSVLVSSLDSI